MAIRQSKYIDITSGVGGARAVKNREFIARCFTTNNKCGIGHVLEFPDANSVMEYFGNDSHEYKFAVKYFGFVSKSITKAKKISFAGWNKNASSAYVLATVQADGVLASYTGSNKKIAFSLGDKTVLVENIDFAEASSLDDVLATIQSGIREKEGLDTAEVSIDDSGRVKITLGNTSEVVNPCPLLGSTNDDLAYLLGLTKSNGVVCSNTSVGETPAVAIARVDEISNNCGSLVFLDYSVTDDEAEEISKWIASRNYGYLYICDRKAYTNALGNLVDEGGIVALSNRLGKSVGTCLWAFKSESDYIAALPAALFATTDYGTSNATKTFMYQRGDFQASITSDKSSTELDNANINYVGQTQYTGSLLDFTQDGNCLDGTEIAVYCNEVWLKSKLWADIMNLFLTVDKVPANDDGVTMLRTIMMDSITAAIENRTILKSKELTTEQKLYIGEVTGDNDAWKQVYNDGFCLKVRVEKDDSNKYIFKYVLVYSKGDSIRKVEGQDILI